MTLKQRIDQHDKEIADIRAAQLKSEQNLTRLERIMRQGFQTLAELHGETQRELQKMSNALSTLIELHADHERRLNDLEGKS